MITSSYNSQETKQRCLPPVVLAVAGDAAHDVANLAKVGAVLLNKVTHLLLHLQCPSATKIKMNSYITKQISHNISEIQGNASEPVILLVKPAPHMVVDGLGRAIGEVVRLHCLPNHGFLFSQLRVDQFLNQNPHQ